MEAHNNIPVAYQLRHSILEKIRSGSDPLPDIHGRDEVKKDVLRALLSGAHPYLVSEEGTGKTRLARALVKLLPPVPVLKGCMYNDDPEWPAGFLCPRCRRSKDPVEEFGVGLVPGKKRFSRIQGNEYTNEAKLLGLKDIQAIAQGKNPFDPEVFIGTGFFRANRGILFVDELPAIRTRVQVLFHPVLEEKKVILEEYNWEYPIDLVLIATGNPEGYSHVNEVPRPMLDRLEMIYMDLPEAETEREIMLEEKFQVKAPNQPSKTEENIHSYTNIDDLERKVIAPWWTIDLLNSAVRKTRKCHLLDKQASIRGTVRAMDHTYSSVELENRNVANLKDVTAGLKLALRGRIRLRADLLEFENPKENFEKTDKISEDLLWQALEDLDFPFDINQEKLSEELNALFPVRGDGLSGKIRKNPEITRLMEQMKNAAKDKITDNLMTVEKKLALKPENAGEQVIEEYTYSALETIVNVALYRGIFQTEKTPGNIFVPEMVNPNWT